MTLSLYEGVAALLDDKAVAGSLPDKPIHGLASLALEVIELAGHEAAQLERLKTLLTWPAEPDPLAEILLALGEKLSREESLKVAFSAKRDAYRLQFSGLHALDAMGDAITEYLLAKAAVMQPFAASESQESYRCTLLKVQDVEAAKFMAFPAQLYDLSEADLPYHEVMLELESEALPLLRSLDPLKLSLRFVFEATFAELKTADASLFDVEVNLPEKRLYAKCLLLDQMPQWERLESIVIMGGNTP